MVTIIESIREVGVPFVRFIAQGWTNYRNNKQLIDKLRELIDDSNKKMSANFVQLQSEINHMQAEMEASIHLLRMDEINKMPDEIVKKLAQKANVSSWPLKVLPFVIKGESFGSLIGGGVQTISVHCFLTPSNNKEFNKNVYADLDVRLQSEINSNWSTRTSHPIYYYGGAWKDSNADINHITTCVQQIEVNLRSIPCIVVTPKFMKDGVRFCVKIWGMGEDGYQDYVCDFKNICDSDSSDAIRFSYNYSNHEDFIDSVGDVKESRKKAVETTIYEFSIFIQVLIGYITDMYFWKLYGLRPVLPTLIANMSISTEGLNWIVDGVKSLYFKTIQDYFSEKRYESVIINPHRLTELYVASIVLCDEPDELNMVSQIVNDYCSRQPDDAEFIKMHSFSISAVNDLIISNNMITDQLIWNTLSYFYWAKSGGHKVQNYEEMNADLFSFKEIEAIGEIIRSAKSYMPKNTFGGLRSIIQRKITTQL